MTIWGILSVLLTDLKPATSQLRSAKVYRAPLGLLSGRRGSNEASTALRFLSAETIQRTWPCLLE